MNLPLIKDAIREIKETFPRFLSILAIILLGVAFFVGIKSAAPSILKTANNYYAAYQLPDGRVQSTVGLNGEDMARLESIPDTSWQGVQTLRATIQPGSHVAKVYSQAPVDNRFFDLVEGRFPSQAGEIALDSQFLSHINARSDSPIQIGDQIQLDQAGDLPEDSQAPALRTDSFEVVGFVQTPIYMEKITRDVGVSVFALVDPASISGDLYTEAYFWVEDLASPAYSEDYEGKMGAITRSMEEELEDYADIRYGQIYQDLDREIQSGQADLSSGYQALADGESALRAASQSLESGQASYEEASQDLESAASDLASGQKAYQSGLKSYQSGLSAYQSGQADLAASRDLLDETAGEIDQAYRDYLLGLEEYEGGIQQGEAQLLASQGRIDQARADLEASRSLLEDQQASLDHEIHRLEAYEGQVQAQLPEGMDLDSLAKQKEDLEAGLGAVAAGLHELQGAYRQIQDLQASLAALDQAYQEASLEVDQANHTYQSLLEDPEATGDQVQLAWDRLAAAQASLGQIASQLEAAHTQADTLGDPAKLQAQEAQLLFRQEDLEGQLASLDQALLDLDTQGARLKAARGSLESGQEELNRAWAAYESGSQELAAGQADIDQGWQILEAERQSGAAQLAQAQEAIQSGRQALESGEREWQSGRQDLDQARKDLEWASRDLESAQADLEFGRQGLESGQEALKEGQADLESGQASYQEGLEEYESQRESVLPDLQEAEAKLAQAQKDLEAFDSLDFYVSDRSAFPAYDGIKANADQIDMISQIFPFLFFAIALLVTFTTLKRMIDEQRNYMGTLKQLGYSDGQVVIKFALYAFLAAGLGTVLGNLLGYAVFPPLIVEAYNAMYHFHQSEVVRLPHWDRMAAGLALATALVPAVLIPLKKLNTAPAKLLQPEAPRSGKKIFLEKFPRIWQRISFKNKMTLRNLLRYKGRNATTLLGIAGCTMLIVTGFGISNTIVDLADIQVNEIYRYDASYYLAEDALPDQLANRLASEDAIQWLVPMTLTSLESPPPQSQTVTLAVPHGSPENFRQAVQLRRREGEVIDLNQDGPAINERLQEHYQLSLGSTLQVEDRDFNRFDLPVGSIFENYIGHAAFMTPETYREIFKEEPRINAFYVGYVDDPALDKNQLEGRLSQDPDIMTIINMDVVTQSASSAMDSLGLITVVLIVAAAGLAFVVLYNLTNINIGERIKELATIKVLGFYNLEVSKYIYDEVFILSVLGSLLGLVFGYGLTHYIMKTVQTPNLLFHPTIHWVSYVYSIGLTLVFSTVVMVVMHFKLKEIDVVEAMKAMD